MSSGGPRRFGVAQSIVRSVSPCYKHQMLNQHIDYTIWASLRILEAAANLTPDELTRDFGTADKSILGTLLHVYGGDLVWIERVHGTSLTSRPYDARGHAGNAQSRMAARLEPLERVRCGRSPRRRPTPKSPTRPSKGMLSVSPAWQIVLHVVNHGSHHRGQAAGFIRALGKTPPVLDLMHYYRASA